MRQADRTANKDVADAEREWIVFRGNSKGVIILKPSPIDTHKVTCIDGKVREKPYKYFNCIHCHWKHWIHYQQKMAYTICGIHSDKKYERDCVHEKNPFECEHFEVKESED